MTQQRSNKFKCVIWDLDNTLWDGVLLESTSVCVHSELVQVIKTLDQRGILHSIASRNDYASVEKKLTDLGLWEYFIYPEISWNDKSKSIENIAKKINISFDSIAFVDDQSFELDEVKSTHPTVSVFSPDQARQFVDNHEFIPRFITNESAQRRFYYQQDEKRNKEEAAHGGNIDFLKGLGLKLSINRLTEEDLKRAEELTIRTHQLNTTGVAYSYEELYNYMHSESHEVLSCSLEDKYGSYGTIGLTLFEKNTDHWMIHLLLVSCRVMSRNIVNTLLAFIYKMASNSNVFLRAKFVSNDVNRQMYITYKFSGFEEIISDGIMSLLELRSKRNLMIPDYIEIRSECL